ncbi:MAG: hypothetical protein EBV24_10350, partial [Actinobacteria bacterium]|nr:hypothetical protein [Actinomycetota bacterium]
MIALTLLEPWRLVLLVLPVGLVVFALVDAGRKPSRRMRFSSLDLFDGLAVRPSFLKQVVPLVLVVLALSAGSIAAARPAYEETDKS